MEISAVAVSLKKKKTEKLIFLTILLYINKHEENVYKRQLEDGIFFFFKQKTAYEISACLVGSEMCIRDRLRVGAEYAWREMVMARVGLLYQEGIFLSLIHI